MQAGTCSAPIHRSKPFLVSRTERGILKNDKPKIYEESEVTMAQEATPPPAARADRDAETREPTAGVTHEEAPSGRDLPSAPANGPLCRRSIMARPARKRRLQPRPCSRRHRRADDAAVVAAAVTADRVRAGRGVHRVAACTRCAELAQTRTQTVFAGNAYARLAFGEAPSRRRSPGRPFVDAGQLLTDAMRRGCAAREDVYILNILRCRPPGNRTPLPERRPTAEYLDAQLAIVSLTICCPGSVAAQTSSTRPSRSAGSASFFDYRAKVIHLPSCLPIAQPSAKRQVWEDLQMLMAAKGLEALKSE